MGPPAHRAEVVGACVVSGSDGVAFTLEYGTAGNARIVMTGPLTVHYADPQILIAGDMLRGWCGGTPPELPSTLEIRGENRRVIYRVSSYLPDGDVYEAEFPD
jgi:hypothetical protein